MEGKGCKGQTSEEEREFNLVGGFGAARKIDNTRWSRGETGRGLDGW